MSLVSGIDHVIVAVNHLETAADLYANKLGLHISGGGTHPAFGTSNRVIVMQNEYIELLSFLTGSTPSGAVGRLAAQRQGVVACILGTDDPTALRDTLAAAGVEVTDPLRGALDAGPEYSRGWTTLAPLNPTLPGLPFFIRHDSNGQERIRLLHGKTGEGSHRLGAVQIVSVTIAVKDAHPAAIMCANLLGLDRGQAYEDDMLGAQCETVVLPDGATLVFASPNASSLDGNLRKAIDNFGEGAFAMTLSVRDLAGAVQSLRRSGFGVRVDEPDGVLVAAQLNHRQTFEARIGLVAAP